MGTVYNIGPIGQGTYIEPGSRYGQGSGGNDGSSVPLFPGRSSGGSGMMHGMLQDGTYDFMGMMPGLANSSGNNGLNLSGTWASSGFGQQQGPSSGFNFFNPTGTMNSNFSSVPGGGSPFPANGIGSVGVPGVGNPNMPFSPTSGFTGGSGMPGLPGVDAKSLDKIYGKGIGNALSQFLSQGAGFNPAVIQAQWNAAQPIKAQTLSKMQTMFGDQGSAYSSTAAIGYGDFSSQFDAALEGQFAQEYQQSVQNYLNVLMGVKGDAQQQHQQEPNFLSIASQIAQSIIPFFG
jgi:hypothetical protein